MSEEEGPKEVFIEGIAASQGAVVGLAYIHSKKETAFSSQGVEKDDPHRDLACYKGARGQLIEEWEELLTKQSDEASKNILSAQIEIIRDPELTKRIETLIKEEQFALKDAINEAFSEYIDIFAKSASPVIADRLIDITDIRDRLIEAAGKNVSADIEKKGDIVVAEELSPRQIIALSNEGIKGIIMERGGRTSHAAIIARSVGIPAVTGVAGATKIIKDGTNVCLNGQSGIVYVNPDARTCSQIKKMSGKSELSKKERDELCLRPTVTADSHRFSLRANIEFIEELSHLQRCKAQGVGLLRTEAVYLNRAQFGNRHNQQLFYEEILQKTETHPVTIRLFDIGGDKFLSEEITENNPFLGWRGIRMLLDDRDLLREQLMAILATAGNHPGRVKLLLPMVTMITEIEEVKKEIEYCRQLLADEGEAVEENIPLGIMVETPNVAVQAEYFAKEVDFFSIGTNDLIQYLLAVDRGNARISHLYTQLHPVMWQLIDRTVREAHNHEIEAEVCGELASYPVAAACLLGLNIDGLSMSPTAILRVKKLLTSRTMGDMKALADEALQCSTLEQVETLFDNWINAI